MDETGLYIAKAPDFPGCTATGSELGRTIARIHLQLEGLVSDILINGELLPTITDLNASTGRKPTDNGDYYQIHINLVHLAAVARHQTRSALARSAKRPS